MTVQQQELEQRYYELTKYPKIFIHSYWGCFRENPRFFGREITKIVENRNNFVEKYNISKSLCYKKKTKYILTQAHLSQNYSIDGYNCDDFRDHIEFYKTKDGNIITIFSTYISDDDYEKYERIAFERGYVRIEPLYTTDQKTFLKMIA